MARKLARHVPPSQLLLLRRLATESKVHSSNTNLYALLSVGSAVQAACRKDAGGGACARRGE